MDDGNGAMFNDRTRALYGNGSDRGAWPPAPLYDLPEETDPVREPPTPMNVFRFFLSRFIGYGFVSGIAYGSIVGVFLFIIGAVFGFAYGGFAGLVLGIAEGLTIGAWAAVAYAQGVEWERIEQTVRRVVPIATYFGGLLVAFVISRVTYWSGGFFDNPFIQFVCLVATYASWDAARRMLKSFNEKYR